MTVRRAVSALGVIVAVVAGGAVASASDYPPSGAVVIWGRYS